MIRNTIDGQFNIKKQLLKNDIIRAVRNGVNVVGVKDKDDNSIIVTNNVFASVPLLLAETPAENTVALLSPAAFTGTGKRTRPLPMIYVGGLWRPFEDYAILFKIQFGTQAAPTMNLAAVGDYPFPNRIVIPGGLFNTDGDTMYTIVRTQKHGDLNIAAVQCRMGKNATPANNSLVFQISPAATNLGGQTSISETERTSLNTYFTQGNGILNTNHGSGFFADKTTNNDFSVDQYLDFSLTTITAGDSVDILSIEIAMKCGSYL